MSEQNTPNQEFWTDDRAEQDPIQAKLRSNMRTRMGKIAGRKRQLWQKLKAQAQRLLDLHQAEEETWRDLNRLYNEFKQGGKSGDGLLVHEARLQYNSAMNVLTHAENHWTHDFDCQEFDELHKQYRAMKEIYDARGFRKAGDLPYAK